MDTNTLYLAVAAMSFLVGVYAVRSFNAVRIRQIDLSIARSRQMARVRAGAKKDESEGREAPEWFFDAIEKLGLGDYLEEEEMPEQLEKLLPMAKGFIDSGGLQKLLSSGGGGPAAQPAVPNEPGWF